MMAKPARTILEVAIAKGGYRKGFRVVTYIEQWTIAQWSLGHEPTLQEAAAWWKESERTWQQRQSEFREIFDLAETPAPIAAAVIATAAARMDRKGSVVAILGTLSAGGAAQLA